MSLVVLLSHLLAVVGTAETVRHPVPAAVLDGARQAVQKLGVEVQKGNYSYLVETMYGPWKAKEVRKAGGMEAFVRKVVLEMPRTMREQGLQVTQFTPGRPTSGFEVRPVMKPPAGGNFSASKEVLHFREWVVFVPTTQRCRVSHDGRVTYVESTGYQVAVATQGKNDWTFINGSTLSVDQLRGLFPTLPSSKERLGLPEIGPFVEVKSGSR